MTQQQFLEEIKQLSIEDRIALIEEISRSVREDFKLHQASVLNASSESGQIDTQTSDENRVPISQQLYGILKFDGDPPTDDEVKDMYADYLMEKYS